MLKCHEARGCDKRRRRRRHVFVKWLKRGNACVVWTYSQRSLIIDDGGPNHVVVVVVAAQNVEGVEEQGQVVTYCATVKEWRSAFGKLRMWSSMS